MAQSQAKPCSFPPAALLQLKKPVPQGHLPLIQAFGSHRALWEIEGLGSNLVLLLVQQVLLASCCYALGFRLQTMKEEIKFEINLSLGPSFEGKPGRDGSNSHTVTKDCFHGSTTVTHVTLTPKHYPGMLSPFILPTTFIPTMCGSLPSSF